MSTDVYVPPDDLLSEDEDPFMQDLTAFDVDDCENRPFAPPEAYRNEFAETQEPARRSQFVMAVDLAERPLQARQWLVPDLIPDRTATLLSADGGTGKSIIAHQLAAAVVTEGQWLGRPVKSGSAILFSAEDDMDELHRRTDDVLRAAGKSYAQAERLSMRSLAGEDALLAHQTKNGLVPSPLFAELEAHTKEMSAALVVVDTLADTFPGNENDRAEARQFVGLLRGLAIRQACAVLLLAHPSLTGMSSGTGTSGSTAWNNSVRSRLYLERIKDERYEQDPDRRILRSMKSNYARTGQQIVMTWRDGAFLADGPETGMDRMAKNAKAERVFLKLLAEFTAEGRRVRPSTGHGYAPSTFAKSGRAEGCGREALHVAMEALFEKGRIKMAEEGPPSKRVGYIVEVP